MTEPTGCLVYPHDTGTGINILTCATFEECGLTYEEIALKDVPANKPFIWITPNYLDAYGLDNSLRNSWTADFSNPDGHGMGHDAFWEMKNSQGEGQ